MPIENPNHIPIRLVIERISEHLGDKPEAKAYLAGVLSADKATAYVIMLDGSYRYILPTQWNTEAGLNLLNTGVTNFRYPSGDIEENQIFLSRFHLDEIINHLPVAADAKQPANEMQLEVGKAICRLNRRGNQRPTAAQVFDLLEPNSVIQEITRDSQDERLIHWINNIGQEKSMTYGSFKNVVSDFLNNKIQIPENY